MSEILSYEKFVENLRAYLLDALNLQEERIYFKVKDEAGMTPEGDRLFVECNVSPEGKEVCGIHTEELYEDYLDGISIKRIGDTVTDEILKLKDAGFFKKVQDVNNYPKVNSGSCDCCSDDNDRKDHYQFHYRAGRTDRCSSCQPA